MDCHLASDHSMPDQVSSRSGSHAFALGVFLCFAASLWGQPTNVSVTPPPEWVRLCDWSAPTNRSLSKQSEGVRYLLREWQQHPQRQEKFTRVLELMENETGVQDCGSLTFGFDPSFQELLLHRVQIHRQGRVLDKLDLAKVRIIQREPDLDGHLFTGDKSVVLFVEDLRVGDVLEYAYSLRGGNPVLNGHYAAKFVVQSSVPLDRQRLRVIWPTDRPLYFRQHMTPVAPSQEQIGGSTARVWDFTNVEAIPYEDDVPFGYEAFPYLEFSDFDNWSRVVDWALPLYSGERTNPAPELQAMIGKWREGTRPVEERARAALEFVQDELRYTGIELGPDSYRPADPSETFRLRYGDCKAKTLLLCTLLREMDIEAYPALVSTSARDAVARSLPSPFAFNHVVVKVLLGGKAVWVDPTCAHQGGSLWNRSLPRLGKALVIKQGGNALEDVPPSAASALTRVTSTFRLKDYVSPASLTVETAYQGAEADNMREFLARTDLKDLTKNYLNFYARYYPGIKEQGSPQIKDQRAQNVLELTEHYEVCNLWEKDKENHRWAASFYSESLERMLTDPDTRLRKMPLRLPYPCKREQAVVVHLPDSSWNLNPVEHKVEGEAFAFHYRRSSSSSVVRFNYDCETKTAAVPPEKVPGYLDKLEEMQNLLGDTLYRYDTSPGAVLARLNWLMVVVTAFGCAATLAGGLWLGRLAALAGNAAPPVLPPASPDEARLQGLGGWLIVVGFGLCSSLVWRPVALLKNWEGFFGVAAWQAVAVPGGEHYHPLYGPLLIFEVLGNILLFGLTLLAAWLFFSKRRWFPRVYIALLLGNALILVIDEIVGGRIGYLAASPDPASTKELVRGILHALIWCPYVLKSRRVKATFVR